MASKIGTLKFTHYCGSLYP